MRELIYLSEAKVAQFLPSRPPWWKRIAALTDLEVKTPVAGLGVKFSAESGVGVSAKRLESIVGHIEKSAEWFEHSPLRVGQWVYFDVPMIYRVVCVDPHGKKRGRGGYPDAHALIFVDGRRDAVFGGPNCLLLHGSPKHLVGGGIGADVVDIQTSYPSSDYFMAHWLQHEGSRVAELEAEIREHPSSIAAGRVLRRLREIFGILNCIDGAAWMAGYARITSIQGTLVCATPLFVERVAPPDEE